MPVQSGKTTNILLLLQGQHQCVLVALAKTVSQFTHHCTKLSTRLLYSPSCPSLIRPTTAESSENFWMWHDSVLKVKSDVYRVNRTGESTVPCGAPVLHNTVSDTQSFSLTNCGLSVR